MLIESYVAHSSLPDRATKEAAAHNFNNWRLKMFHRRYSRIALGLMLAAVFEGGLALAATYDDQECKNKASHLSTCTSYGSWYCTYKTTGCSGSCYTCGGPGSIPNKYCGEEKDEECEGNLFHCGARTNGNCQDVGGGSCICDGMDGAGGCEFAHC